MLCPLLPLFEFVHTNTRFDLMYISSFIYKQKPLQNKSLVGSKIFEAGTPVKKKKISILRCVFVF